MESPKQFVRRFVEEAQTRHRIEAVDEMMSEDFVDHAPLPGVTPDRAGVRQLFQMFYQAFPDLEATIHDQIEQDGKVVTRKTLSGTHRGEFLGIPPTGRSIAFGVIDVLRVSDGKIREHWMQGDLLGLFLQLGAFPPALAQP